MRDKTAPGSMPLPAHFMNAQSAMVGLRGRDLFSTLRTLAFQSLRQPVHSTRHLLAFGKQLGRVMLGDTLPMCAMPSSDGPISTPSASGST